VIGFGLDFCAFLVF